MIITLSKRPLIWILRSLLCLLLLFILALACVYIYLQRDPQHLVDEWLEPISAKTGLKFEIGSVNVTLLPLPALALSDVRITGPNMRFRMAWVQGRPGLLEMLRGNFLPSNILILRPRLFMTTDLPFNSPDALVASLANAFKSEEREEKDFTLPGNFKLEIDQFDARIKGSGESALRLSNLQADLDLAMTGLVTGDLRFSALRLLENRRTLIASIEQFSLSGTTNLNDIYLTTLNTEGHLRWVGILNHTRLTARLEHTDHGWTVRSRLEGGLDLEGASVPFSLRALASTRSWGEPIAIHNMDWSLDADSGQAEMRIALPSGKNDFSIRGTFTANRLSLTQWLGFARNLAPGLQLALDNIYNARLNFNLNTKRLQVTNIRAGCSGATFSGSGGVSDFAKPVVALNLTSPLVNLGLGLPESVGDAPDAPYFPHPPLTPMPGTPLKPGETGIGYDIRLGATLLRYGPLKIKDGTLRIYPGKMDKSGLEDVLLDAKAQFYGGSLQGTCILGADKSLPMHITAKAKQINGAAIAKDMPILPLRQGKWEAAAVVTSRGKELAPFLANLQGDISVSAANATLEATGPKNVFHNLTASVKLKSAAWASRHLTLDGAWKTAVNSPDWNGSGEIIGKLSFGSDGLTFKQLPGTLTVSPDKELLPGGPRAKVSGKFTLVTDKSSFELSGARVELPGVALTGSARVNTAKMQGSGTISTNLGDLKASLVRLGFKNPKIPARLNRFQLSAEYTFDSTTAQLDKIRGAIGTISLGGSLAYKFKADQPGFEADLALGDIPRDAIPASSGTPSWDFPGVRNLNIKGQIRVMNLQIWDLHFHNLLLPFNLQKGILDAPHLTANFYGAPLTATVHADLRKGVKFDCKLRVNAFDLAQAAKDRKIDTKLYGSVSISADANANLTGTATFASELNGNWKFAIDKGGWQSLDKKGQPSGRAINFTTANASGDIRKGVLTTENFYLISPELKVTGKGWINLVKQNLDCNFYVSMKGIPDFPLTVSGSMTNVKTSIGAGKLILNAVGEVASGFVGAIGGILKGTWNLFKR